MLNPQTYFCGPGVLAKSIKEATVRHSSSTVEFSFAKVSLLISLHASILMVSGM
jgi:hypothetical protein